MTLEDQTTATHQDLQVVGFILAGEEYAIAILDVLSIELIESPIRLPRMPKYIAGVMPLRDEIVPLVQLRKRFELEERAEDEKTRVIVIELGELTVGLVVDAVTSVYRLPADSIQEAPHVARSVGGAFVRGVLKVTDQKRLILLDPRQILLSEETDELARTTVMARHYVDSSDPRDLP
jgi:purine-binding chemotaxis protein CheW